MKPQVALSQVSVVSGVVVLVDLEHFGQLVCEHRRHVGPLAQVVGATLVKVVNSRALLKLSFNDFLLLDVPPRFGTWFLAVLGLLALVSVDWLEQLSQGGSVH